MKVKRQKVKSLLMRMKEESGKIGLEFNIKKMKIMASVHGKYMGKK